jgi:hypothetical protein
LVVRLSKLVVAGLVLAVTVAVSTGTWTGLPFSSRMGLPLSSTAATQL